MQLALEYQKVRPIINTQVKRIVIEYIYDFEMPAKLTRS
jgi:hypothetical protein